MYLNDDSLRGGIYPKTSPELNVTNNDFNCNFLDSNITKTNKGLELNIFDKGTEPEYAQIHMISMLGH